jgi:hypothetical protein
MNTPTAAGSRPSVWRLALALPLLFVGRAAAQGTPLGFEEAFALASERAEALQQLAEGSAEHFYYSCLHAQHSGELDKADELLAAWRDDHGVGGAGQDRIEARQALLRFEQDPARTYAYLTRRFGLRFDVDRVAPGVTPAQPTRLDPELISDEAWLRELLTTAGTLRDVEDHALPGLVARDLSDGQLTELLSRLHRPDVPGLTELVVRELGFAQSRGFGSLDIHRKLLLAQLEECLGARPALLAEPRFIDAYLRRLAPNADEDTDAVGVRDAHLERLERFASRLAPAFDGLKAHIAYHRLTLDLERGTLDVERLLAYLRIARQSSYADPELLQGRPATELAGTFGTGLPRVGKDEPLVREYLARLLVDESSFDRFVGTLRGDYVQRVFAEAKILAGAPDPERWYSLLDDPAYYERLKDRVELEFPRGRRREYAPDELVRIELDVKNVSTLLVKVFEIDTMGYYEAQQGSDEIRDIDAALDLDGLVAHEELILQYDEPPTRRVRRSFDLPRLSRPGVYVVEFVGNGVSSRAVIRKGELSAVERIGAAGHVFRVLDHAGASVDDASIRFGGRELSADARGEIVIPFSTDPGPRQLVLCRGDFGVLHEFTHRAEVYSLEAGVHIEREALIAGEQAEVVVRPRLTLAGERVRLALLEDVELQLVATDLDGVTTSTVVHDFVLDDDKESVHTFQVPPRTVRLGVLLRGEVQSLSEAEGLELESESTEFEINGIDATNEVVSPLLMRSAAGYTLELRGKNGEALAGNTVALYLKHRNHRPTRSFALATDNSGRIELGALAGIESLEVSGVGAEPTRWRLSELPRAGAWRQVHVLVGDVVRVPYEGSATRLEREHVSLLELRSELPTFDRSGDVTLVDGYVEARGLTAGDYRLSLYETGQSFDIRVTGGRRVAGHSHGGVRRLELSRPMDLAITSADIRGDALVVQLAGAGPRARVHVTASRYVPAFDAHTGLALSRQRGLDAETVVSPGCAYESGRRISDEYRYILDRRFAQKYPGNMLARAGVLLNPWAIDESTDATLGGAGSAGGRFRGGEGSRRGGASAGPESPGTEHAGGRSPSFGSLDFLAEPAVVQLNLVPDAEGVVRVPLDTFGSRPLIRVVAVDDEVTLSRTILRREAPVVTRERRLVLTLDPAQHFAVARRIEFVDAGASVTITDAANADVETYDSLDDVFRLFATQSGDIELRKFDFLLRWPALKADEKRARYSDFACHELHVFLRQKDPLFFQDVVAPYLANKADTTFLDHWLLGADLAQYFEPWRFARLNTFERILLLRGIEGAAARHVRELVELLPPEEYALRTYFDAVLAASALDTDRGDLAEGLAEMRRRSEEAARQGGAFRGPGDSVPSSGGAPSSPGPGGPSSPGPSGPAAPGGGGSAPKSRGGGEEITGSDDFFLGTGRVQERAKREAELKQLDDLEDAARGEDVTRRPQQRAFFRALPDTAELAERNYWRVLIGDHDADLISPTPFWLDFAESRPGEAFVSEHFPLATRNVTEMLLALALLDLPFEASAHTTDAGPTGVELRAGSRLLLAHKGFAEVQVGADVRPILIGQDLFRLDDPFLVERGRKRDKLVTGELVKGVPYGCRVVVTNPTSSPVEVELLLQIPEGALPVGGGFRTKSVPVSLAGYGSESIEYSFYFPTAGAFRHFPVHVGEDGTLLAFARAVTLDVVDRPTLLDTRSWGHVSQSADVESVFEYIEATNLARLDLSRVAWRMQERVFCDRMLATLRARFVFDTTLWSYGLLHRDERATREYLAQRSDLVALCGPWFESRLLSVEPVERHSYQHLEYEPLVNGRTHRFGPERRVLNSSVARQYAAFLGVLSHKPRLDADDRMELVYYLALQDRIEEALGTFDTIEPSALESRLQYDYMRAYFAFYTSEPSAARRIAEPYVDHPVQRWRARFRDVLAQLDEAEGRGAVGVQDESSRDQQQGALAATEPALELAVEARRVSLSYANVSQAEIRYRPMDIELLFSTNPFLAVGARSVSSLKPNRVDVKALPKGQDTLVFDLPAEFHAENVLVEVRAGRVVRSEAYYANDLRVQGLEAYGQISVRRATDGAPLPATYVKVYARLADGRVRFHKDGYTDLRGRFDYVSLSGMDGAQVERFSVLVMSDQHGALVRELAPPRQ